MTDVRILATGMGFPEGPVAMPDGSEVALPDCDGAAILAVSPDGCELIDVDADEEAWVAFRAAVILATWLWAAGR